MALISDKVLFRLQELFPDVKMELVNGNKSLLINGNSFHSYYEGEPLEKFGKIGEGYQNSVLKKMQAEIIEFLKQDEKVFAVPEKKVFTAPEVKVPTKPEIKIAPEDQKVLDSVDDDEEDK